MFITAGEVLNRVAAEALGLEDVPDPFGSSDPIYVQLRSLLQSAAGDLLDARPTWPHLVQPYTLVTVTDQTDYGLPPDFRGMLYKTGWNKTASLPLHGPASPAHWERLVTTSAGVSLCFTFRLSPLAIAVWPPPPADVELTFEYASAYWVAPQGSTLPITARATRSSDVVWFDDLLIVRALKLKFLQAKGFDTAVAAREYQDSLSATLGRAGSAPTLSLSRSPKADPFSGPVGSNVIINTGSGGGSGGGGASPSTPSYDDNPPTPSVGWRNKYVIVRDTTTLVESLMICLLGSTGAYEWRVVTQSS